MSFYPSDSLQDLTNNLNAVAKKALLVIKPNSLGVFSRTPLIHEECPEVSDVDLVSIWNRYEEKPERIAIMLGPEKFFVDILWVPFKSIADAVEAARSGMLPILLRHSKLLWVRSDTTRSLVSAIKRATYRKSAWQFRIRRTIEVADSVLDEARLNADCPQASLFFTQIAHSYYTAAIADSLRLNTLAVLTHPLSMLKAVDDKTGQKFTHMFLHNLSLTTPEPAPVHALRKLHDLAYSERLSSKPGIMSFRTWWHYLYSLSPLELEYREIVVRALNQCNSFASANLYMRFWAYSILRCIIVSEEVREGKNPAFYAPFEPIGKSILRVCPKALDGFTQSFGKEITGAISSEAIAKTLDFRNAAIDLIDENPLLAK